MNESPQEWIFKRRHEDLSFDGTDVLGSLHNLTALIQHAHIIARHCFRARAWLHGELQCSSSYNHNRLRFGGCLAYDIPNDSSVGSSIASVV